MTIFEQPSPSTMSTTSTTLNPSSIYYIVVAGGGSYDSQRLTDGEEYVTILPPSVGNDPRQEVYITFMTSSIVCRSPTM